MEWKRGSTCKYPRGSQIETKAPFRKLTANRTSLNSNIIFVVFSLLFVAIISVVSVNIADVVVSSPVVVYSINGTLSTSATTAALDISTNILGARAFGNMPGMLHVNAQLFRSPEI